MLSCSIQVICIVDFSAILRQRNYRKMFRICEHVVPGQKKFAKHKMGLLSESFIQIFIYKFYTDTPSYHWHTANKSFSIFPKFFFWFWLAEINIAVQLNYFFVIFLAPQNSENSYYNSLSFDNKNNGIFIVLYFCSILLFYVINRAWEMFF